MIRVVTLSRLISLSLLAGLGWTAPAAAQPPAASERFVRLEALERMALERNPTVAQADAVVASVLGRVRQARAYPNPIVGYQGDEIGGGDRNRSRHSFFVQQSIVTAGKRKYVQQAVAQEQAHAEAERVLQRQRVLNAVRILFWEALGVARQVEIRRDLAQLTREAVDVSEQLYNVGQADRPDVLEVELEAQRAAVELARAEHDLDRAWGELAAMVGDPDLARAPLAGDIEAELPTVDEARVRAQLRDSPEILIARARVAHARASLARARADRVPNVFVRGGLGYNFDRTDSGRDIGTQAFVEIGVPLPLFDRNAGNIATAEGQVKVAEGELRRTELAVQTRLAGALRAYRDARRTAESYQAGMLGRAQRSYELHLERFRQMAAAYPQVLLARRTLGQIRVEYVRALVDLRQSAIVLDGLLVTGGLIAPEAVPGEPAVTVENVPFTITP